MSTTGTPSRCGWIPGGRRGSDSSAWIPRSSMIREKTSGSPLFSRIASPPRSSGQKPVRLVRDREKEDVYGRLLAYVWTDERTMFNEALSGKAMRPPTSSSPLTRRSKKGWSRPRRQARKAEKGIWAESPGPPSAPAEARERLGEVVTVRFRCVRSFDAAVQGPGAGRRGVRGGHPEDVLAALPGSLDFERRVLDVTGLIEELKARPQIMIGLPIQVKIADAGR